MNLTRPSRPLSFLFVLAIVFIPGIAVTAALAANQLGYCVNSILPGGGDLNAPPYLLTVDADSAALRLRSTVSREATLTYSSANSDPVSETIPAAKLQTAVLADLTPGSTYDYKIERGDQSWEGTFRTPSGPEETVRFDVLGSSGVASEAQHAIADEIAAGDPDFVLHTGDVVFPRGALCQYGLKYFGPYEEFLGNVPVAPAVGDVDLKAASGSAFRETFSPAEASGSSDPLYYAFDYGPVHVTVLDSELYEQDDESAIDTQRAWLTEELASNTLPWSIVVIHRPLYSSTSGAPSETIREDLGPIFSDYGVDLVLSGHARNYERFASEDGIAYVVTGGGGAKLQDLADDRTSTAAASVHHFLSVSASPNTISVRVIDDKGTVIDSFTLDQG